MAFYVQSFCRIAVGLAFLISSVSKARDFSLFVQTIVQFNVLPKYLGRSAALLILGGEFMVVLFLSIGGELLGGGFIFATILLSVFSLALASVLIRKNKISCGCFGKNSTIVSGYDILRNLGFIICAVIGVYTLMGVRQWQGELNIMDWTLTALAACAFVGIWVQLGEVGRLLDQVKLW